jgi:hypothetical protein
VFVEIANQARSALAGKQLDQGVIGELIELYGCSKKLTAHARQIQDFLKRDLAKSPKEAKGEVTPQFRTALNGFFLDLRVFDVALSSLGFMTIDVYYPGLSQAVYSAIGSDIDFGRYYNDVIVKQFDLRHRKVPLAFLDLVGTVSGDFGYEPVLADSAEREIGENVRVPDLEHLCAALLRCQELIGTIIRENWTFRDVVERRERALTIQFRGEVTQVKNQYNIDRSQVGAVGDGATVQNSQFEQNTSEAGEGLDLAKLVQQLQQLRGELSRQASDRNHYAALVALTDAEGAAGKGDRQSVLAHLAKAGKWALDAATKVGLSVAESALKAAIGLK